MSFANRNVVRCWYLVETRACRYL